MKYLAVFCGCNFGTDQVFTDVAEEFGRQLVSNQLSLVYGGANCGLMGVIADAVLAKQGEVVGVLPKEMVKVEIAHEGISKLHLVDGMQERKALINDLSDGFVMLPGGIGSLDEFFEVYTWLQLGYHKKPVGILNTNGYFDLLIAQLDLMTEKQLLKERQRDLLIIESSPAQLIKRFVDYQPTDYEGKWVKQ